MWIGVQGCAHGELDVVYDQMKRFEQELGERIALLIVCGDFQAVRDEHDLASMACPAKYKRMGDFHKYYRGELEPPVPTLFIGGNHEASHYMMELYHGGWVSREMYFMGFSNVIWFNGLRIGGISGIYNRLHYNQDHFEQIPLDPGTIRSVYYTRKLEIDKLNLIRSPIDVFLSHDWPLGIHAYGNVSRLLRRKPFLAHDVSQNRLGSPPLMELLKRIRPRFWFSAHMHVKFSATIDHLNPRVSTVMENDGKFDQAISDLLHIDGQGKTTRFLSLDKCGRERSSMQILRVKGSRSDQSEEFYYDPEWMAIAKTFHPGFSGQFGTPTRSFTWSASDLEANRKWIESNVEEYRIPAMLDPNSQSRYFCKLLGLEHHGRMD